MITQNPAAILAKWQKLRAFILCNDCTNGAWFSVKMTAENEWSSMNNELKELLNLARLPARLNMAQTAAYLGFKPHDIPILVARGLLKPLGRPTPNSEKYFARSKLVEAENNEDWLSRATSALAQHWKEKNARKSRKPSTVSLNAK